jgi:hypothetical protein
LPGRQRRIDQLRRAREKPKAVGTAEADVIKLKIASMDSGNHAGIEISKALAASGFKLVSDVVVSGGGGGTADGGNSLVSVWLANLIRDGRGKRSEQRNRRRKGEDRHLAGVAASDELELERAFEYFVEPDDVPLAAANCRLLLWQVRLN